MRIQTNTAANSALGYMRVNNQATERSIQKLSSGFRINRAGDDAAGLAIANKLRSDIRGLGQAQKNVAQGSAMLQVMDGATQTVGTILDRMKELATQANSANVGTQADKLQKEFTQLRSEIDRIVDTTKYQGTSLVDGTFGYSITGGTPAVAGTPGTPAVNATVAATGTGDFAGFSASVTNGTQANALTSDITFSSDGTDVTATWAGGGTATITAANLAAGGTFALGSSGVSVSFAASTTTTAGDAGTLAVSQFQAAVAPTAGTPAVAGTRTGSTGSFQVSSSGNYALGSADQVQVAAVNLDTGSAGLNLASLDISSQAGSAAALTALDNAVNTVNTALGDIGAAQSRMDFASSNVQTLMQNTQAAESTIRDADMAEEMTKFTKSNILQQAAQSMLSQANQGTQGILQLLRG